MKKMLTLLLSLSLVFSMTACSSGDTSTPDTSTPDAGTADSGTADAGEASDAQWAPDERVTIIVSYAAGSGTDNTARVLAAFAEKYIGQSVVIENLEGGSGSIGWTSLSMAEPDGHTLGFVNLPNFNSSITEGLADYLVDDFTALCNHVTETSVVLVKADSPYNTLEELVEAAAANPGGLKASTNGNRASNHIGAQMLSTTAGFTYLDVPYGGTADQLLALRQGEVDFSVAKVADFASFTSEVKVLGVFDENRIEEYPDVPTQGELGYYGEWLGSSRCIVGPAGLPAGCVEFYEAAFEQIMNDPDYLAAAESASITTDYMDAATTSTLISQQQDFAESLESIWE